MKRKIEVKTPNITITALIDAKGLTTDEMERVRDSLADNLMEAASNTRYLGVAMSRVQVR